MAQQSHSPHGGGTVDTRILELLETRNPLTYHSRTSPLEFVVRSQLVTSMLRDDGIPEADTNSALNRLISQGQIEVGNETVQGQDVEALRLRRE